MLAELPPVMGHNVQLQEVVYNLVNNAIEAMQSVEQPRVLTVATGLDTHGAIALTVEDTGPGVAPGQAESIFDAFVTTKPQGMGLGLAICRMIVERHGGQLSVSAAAPRGAIFKIRLPALAANFAASAPRRPQAATNLQATEVRADSRA
jgi:signal transduction histidine kinase